MAESDGLETVVSQGTVGSNPTPSASSGRVSAGRWFHRPAVAVQTPQRDELDAENHRCHLRGRPEGCAGGGEGARSLHRSPGPYAVALLADQGAEVVKVERPGIGDIARWVGVSVNGMSAFSWRATGGNVHRRLATDEGREIVMALAAAADVIVQNFRPGVIDRLGFGYEAVRALNPEVIYCSVSGYGAEGPYRHRSAYDTSIQAYAGFAANQADPSGGPPTFLHQNAADKVSALFASQAIAASCSAGHGPWRAAPGDGYGRRLRVLPVGRVRRQRGAPDSDGSQASSFNAGFQPMRFLDGWGIVVPTTDADFAGMCRALGVDGFDDPRIATIGERRNHRDVLEPILDMCYAMAANLTQDQGRRRASTANGWLLPWSSLPTRS